MTDSQLADLLLSCQSIPTEHEHEWGEWSKIYIDMGGSYQYRDCKNCLAEEIRRDNFDKPIPKWML